jgi:hypothetical protein
MKNSNIKFFLLLFLLPACAQIGRSSPAGDVSIDLTKTDEAIVMSVSAGGDKPVEIYNATVLSALPEDPGIVLAIEDIGGKKFDRCAMINPAYKSGEFALSTLRSGQPLSQSFEIASLARQYCLIPGEYVMQIHIKQPGKIYSSNSIRFKLSRDFRPQKM